MNPSSLMGRVPLFVPLRCFCYDLFVWFKSLSQKNLSLTDGGGEVAGSTESSYLTLEPPVLMVGSVFLCIHFSFSFFRRLTGFQLPSPIVSTGSRLTLWLLSDYAVSGQGFKAVFEGKSTSPFYFFLLNPQKRATVWSSARMLMWLTWALIRNLW